MNKYKNISDDSYILIVEELLESLSISEDNEIKSISSFDFDKTSNSFSIYYS